MICHEFKGGIGTASACRLPNEGRWTVGVLVQANHGRRARLPSTACRSAREIGFDEVPSRWIPGAPRPSSRAGARARSSWSSRPTPRCCPTSAPGWPSAPASASRAMGGVGEHVSGDIFLGLLDRQPRPDRRLAGDAATPRHGADSMLSDSYITPLFEAVVEATEEAIVNALLACRDDGRAGRDHGPRPAGRAARLGPARVWARPLVGPSRDPGLIG